jgi:hypothetical protein
MRKTKQAHQVGKRTEEVLPEAPGINPADWIGSMKDTFKIVGDIVAPAGDEDEWEVLRD